MLLSFSVDAMRPMVEAGFRQYCGEDVGDQRVKRQTIRQLGVRGERLLALKDPCAEMSLHLWWKSRTPARAFMGEVERWRVYRVTIVNHTGLLLFNAPGLKERVDHIARADGFENTEAFKNYFVPNPGDGFNGVLYKW